MSEEEKKEDNQAKIDENNIKKILKHPQIEPRVQEEVKKQAELLYKRNAFLQQADSDILSKMDRYSTVAKPQFEALKEKISNTKQKIHETSFDDIDNLEKELKMAIDTEQNLAKQLQQNNSAPIMHQSSNIAPKNSKEVFENPELYKDFINQETKRFSVYDTKRTIDKIDGSNFGSWDKSSSVRKMNKCQRDFEDMCDDNQAYSHLCEII